MINLANGNLHLEFPIASVPQRGRLPYEAKLVYDSRVWQFDDVGTFPSWNLFIAPPTPGFVGTGWRLSLTGIGAGASDVVATNSTHVTFCTNPPMASISSRWVDNFVMTDSTGTRRFFGNVLIFDNGSTGCDGNILHSVGFARDGSGYQLVADKSAPNFISAIYDKYGTQVYPSYIDANGNILSTALSANNTLDTLDSRATVPVQKTVSGNVTFLDVLNSQGSRSRYTITYQTISFSTNFQEPAPNNPQVFVTEASGSMTVVQSIALPNGTSYSFTYDQGTTPGHYGMLTSMTLPTGAVVNFGYTNFKDSRCVMNRWLTSRTSGAGTWLYTPTSLLLPCNYHAATNTAPQQVVVTKPSGDATKLLFKNEYTFSFNTEVDYFTGSSATAAIKKEFKDYYNDSAHSPLRITTQLLVAGTSYLTKKVEYVWDTPTGSTVGNLTLVKEWQFYSGTPPASPDRTTNIAYLSGAPYLARNISGLPTSVTVTDAAGNQIKQTTYGYDGTAVTTKSGVVQHDYTNYPTTNTVRGNLTTVNKWLKTTNTFLTTTNFYDEVGHLLQAQNPLGNSVFFDYTDTWTTQTGGSTCAPVGGQAQAIVTRVTNALNQPVTSSFYSCTSLLGSSTDLNGRTTSYVYDGMNRQIQTNFADGGRQNNDFDDTVNAPSVKHRTLRDTLGSEIAQFTRLDSLGRTIRTELCEDGSACAQTIKTDTTYDTTGRVLSVSNPYRTNTDPTFGTTSYSYDGLDRVLVVTKPDGGTVATSYSGGSATVTDETGKKRTSQIDGLGRLVSVTEDPGVANYLTNYAYDLNNNMTCVEQQGNVTGTGCSSPPSSDATSPWRVRRFAYDSLSRLTSATNPESGTIAYTYDNNSNVKTRTAPKPNQTGTATVTTTYTYDALDRLTQKSYDDTTPAARHAYDGGTLTGCTTAPPVPSPADANAKGYRTAMCDGSGATAWTHDVLGRILQEKRTIIGSTAVTKSTSYAYNVDGSVASQTYPSGRVLNYTYDAAGRPASAVDPTGPIKYVTAATYAPHGAVTGMNYGGTSTFAGITHTNSYDKRLQPVTLSAATLSATILSLSYNFHLGAGDNGNVFQIVNNRDNNRTQNFTYDNLNRIQQAFSTGPNWGETFTIDPWGNLTNRGTVAGKTNSEPLNAPATIQNRLTGFGYDAAGNMTSNGSATYTYDGENRLLTAGGYTYSYDGDGRRLKRQSGSLGILSWPDLSGTTLDESGLTGSFVREYAFFGGKRVARRDTGNNAVHYFFSDHLGSTDLVTNATGTMGACTGTGYVSGEQETDYYPFGGEYPAFCSTITDQKFKFTGKERDSESGLDMFGARYYASSLGRFMIPDWAAKPTSVPYANFGNPQSLNLYGYVANNPTTLGDPDGHCFEDACAIEIGAYVLVHYIMPALITYYSLKAIDSISKDQSATAGGGSSNTRSNSQATPSPTPSPGNQKGTNKRGEKTSRSKLRKSTKQKAWDNATDHQDGGKACPTCGKQVDVDPNSGQARDWDVNHDPKWSEREFAPDATRQDVIDNYQEGTELECPTCNRADNQPTPAEPPEPAAPAPPSGELPKDEPPK
jgi:RHS repeat-associated protein